MVNAADMLALALDVALAGGEVAMSYFRRNPETSLKADGTWVSQADRAAEKEMRSLLAKRTPGYNILGEEEGLAGADGGPADPAAPTWILDPIDGTNNYLAGIPIWGTLVALTVDGEHVVGVAHAPALGETYDAARGLGARANAEPVAVSATSTLSEATVVTPGYEGFEKHGLGESFLNLVRRARRDRGFGDFWGHMLVARGAVDVMVDPVVATWDFAALVPIIEEAGGRITTTDGGPPADGAPCISTNGPLHEEVLALLDPRHGERPRHVSRGACRGKTEGRRGS